MRKRRYVGVGFRGWCEGGIILGTCVFSDLDLRICCHFSILRAHSWPLVRVIPGLAGGAENNQSPDVILSNRPRWTLNRLRVVRETDRGFIVYYCVLRLFFLSPDNNTNPPLGRPVSPFAEAEYAGYL